MTRFWLIILSGLALVTSCTSIPQERPAKTENRNPLEYIQILESADRVRDLQIDRVVKNLHLEPGDVVADIGSGSGLFTIPLARQVLPGGRVYAVDIEQEFLSYVEELSQRNHLDNIKTILGDELDPRIPEAVDFVLICDTLSYISDQSLYLQGLTRYLRDGARIAVIDRLGQWPPHLEQGKYTPEELDRWMKNIGMEKEETLTFLENAFFNIYRYSKK